jgi:hypothetical protein
MASSVAGPNSVEFLPVGTPEGARLRSPSRTIEDLVARFQAVVTTIVANVFRENAVRRNAICLEMTESASNIYCNYEATMLYIRLQQYLFKSHLKYKSIQFLYTLRFKTGHLHGY